MQNRLPVLILLICVIAAFSCCKYDNTPSEQAPSPVVVLDEQTEDTTHSPTPGPNTGENPSPSETPHQTEPPSPLPVAEATTTPDAGSGSVVTPRPAEIPADASVDETPAAQTVSVAVYGLDGEVLIGPVDVTYDENDKGIDALRKAGKLAGVNINTTGSGQTAYVKSIAGLKEFDHGPLSGWVYLLNGVYATKGAGSVAVSPGDTVEFRYTLEMGREFSDSE